MREFNAPSACDYTPPTLASSTVHHARLMSVIAANESHMPNGLIIDSQDNRSWPMRRVSWRISIPVPGPRNNSTIPELCGRQDSSIDRLVLTSPVSSGADSHLNHNPNISVSEL